MSLILNKKTRGQKHDIIEEIHNHNILVETRETFLHGEPGSENEDSGTDYRMAMKFIKNIRFLESVNSEPIIIHQHNLGGWWDAGMIIYDMIKSSRCHIIFVMHGSACSMGSIIPQAADIRLVMPNAQYMIHMGNTDIVGQTYKQAQSWSKIEKRQADKMVEIYVTAMLGSSYFAGKSEKRVRQFFTSKMNQNEDWFLFADETVLMGFADGVVGNKDYETIDEVKERIMNG